MTDSDDQRRLEALRRLARDPAATAAEADNARRAANRLARRLRTQKPKQPVRSANAPQTRSVTNAPLCPTPGPGPSWPWRLMALPDRVDAFFERNLHITLPICFVFALPHLVRKLSKPETWTKMGYAALAISIVLGGFIVVSYVFAWVMGAVRCGLGSTTTLPMTAQRRQPPESRP